VKEHQITSDCIAYIKGLDVPSWAQKFHGSQYSSGGEPDIDACVDGRSVKVEVKRPGNRPTPRQYHAMRRWEAAGALTGWVTSVADLQELLTHLYEREWKNPTIERGA